ncbi:MAG: MFS transporter, partial [Actinobacteria bacterium]|nr:MFS transporter [Actinomycetota bacterium]
MRRARVAVAAAFFVHGAMPGFWAPRIPYIKANLGLGEGALGLALLGPAVGALGAMLLTGAIIARGGGRTVVRLTLVASCVVLPLPVMAPSFAWLVASLVLLGACLGAMDVAMNAHGVGLQHDYGRPLISSFHGMWSLGGFAGALITAGLIQLGGGPAPHLVGAALVLAIAGLVLTRGLIGDDPNADDSPPGPRFARPTMGLALLAGLAFCAVFAEGAAHDWSAVYMRESLLASEAVAAGAYATFSLAMAAGRFSGDRLALRIGPVPLLRACGVLAAVGLAFPLLVTRPWAGVVGFGCLGAGLSCVVPLAFGAAGRAEAGAGPGIASVATASYTGLL